MPDVHDVLTGAADDLGSVGEPDVARAWRRGRHLRRRRAASLVLAALVVLGGVASGALFLTRDNSGPSVSVADAGTTPAGVTAIPAEWATVTNEQFGMSMRVPPDWQSTNQSLTPNLVDPHDVLSAGTFSVPPEGSCILPPSVQNLASTDAFVTLYTWRQDAGGFPPRPDHFGPELGNGPILCVNVPNGVARMINFSDHGRQLSALVVIGNDATPQRRTDAFRVLDSLVVTPAASPDITSTTLAAFAPLTGPVATAPLSTPPTTYAKGSIEDKVRTAFLGWTDTKPLAAKGPFIEDFDQIKATMEQAKAQAPPGLDALHGVIESVTIVDATHAHVVYGFVNGDQPVVSGLPGDVVKIGGKWLVTRDTVCASFELEGVRCPPRTG
jgi:hypothetical protein